MSKNSIFSGIGLGRMRAANGFVGQMANLQGRGMRLLTMLLLVTGLSQMAHAQNPLSLDQAIQTALRKNFDIEIQRNNVAARQLQNTVGVAGGLPTVSATANDQAQVTDIYQKLATGTVIERKGALGNNLSASVNGTMVLYNGLRIQATKDRLEQLAQQSEQILSATIQDVVARVMTQYFEVYRQQRFLLTIEASYAVARQNLEIVEARQLAGLANNADLFQARLDLNALRQQRGNQQSVIIQAESELLALINEDPWQPIAITDSIVVDSGLAFDSLLQGLRNNPQVLAADQQVQVQALAERELSAQRMPTLRANAGYNFSNNVSNGGFNLLSRNLGPYAGLNLSVPIYNGGSLKRQEQVAALATRNAQLAREDIVDAQTTALYQAWLRYSNALQLLTYEVNNNVLSQQLLDLMLQKYSLRLATILELKQAQKSFEESGYRLVNLQFEAKAAEIELRRLAGKLP